MMKAHTPRLLLDNVREAAARHEDSQVPGLRELVGRCSLENAGMLVFDK